MIRMAANKTTWKPELADWKSTQTRIMCSPPPSVLVRMSSATRTSDAASLILSDRRRSLSSLLFQLEVATLRLIAAAASMASQHCLAWTLTSSHHETWKPCQKAQVESARPGWARSARRGHWYFRLPSQCALRPAAPGPWVPGLSGRNTPWLSVSRLVTLFDGWSGDLDFEFVEGPGPQTSSRLLFKLRFPVLMVPTRNTATWFTGPERNGPETSLAVTIRVDHHQRLTSAPRRAAGAAALGTVNHDWWEPGQGTARLRSWLRSIHRKVLNFKLIVGSCDSELHQQCGECILLHILNMNFMLTYLSHFCIFFCIFLYVNAKETYLWANAYLLHICLLLHICCIFLHNLICTGIHLHIWVYYTYNSYYAYFIFAYYWCYLHISAAYFWYLHVGCWIAYFLYMSLRHTWKSFEMKDFVKVLGHNSVVQKHDS